MLHCKSAMQTAISTVTINDVLLHGCSPLQVPDEFFSRTGAELKGEWAAMVGECCLGSGWLAEHALLRRITGSF
jgi:hypothetical protein